MVGRDLVLNEAPRPRVPQVLGKDCRGVLVDPAERVVPAIRSLHGEALGLLSADAHDGLEPAGEVLEIQDLDLDRCGPQRPIVGPPEPTVKRTGVVLRTDDDSPGGRAGGARFVVGAAEPGHCRDQKAGHRQRMSDTLS